MHIKKIESHEVKEAQKLVLDVFMKYEASSYSDKGIETFKGFIGDENNIKSFDMYGAYDSGKIVGVIATRNEGSHISLFFVDGEYHGQGIGRRLFDAAIACSEADMITVNSSVYAVGIYKKLGFVTVDVEQTTDGIRYTPMKYMRFS